MYGCDGGCDKDVPQLRLLPAGGGSNMILCHRCFDKEIRWRYARNPGLSPECRFDLPAWEDLEVYDTTGGDGVIVEEGA